MHQKTTKEIQLAGGGSTKNRRFIIKSVGYDFKTHEETARLYELIDLQENSLFEDCLDVWEIEDSLERFWNRLNDLDSTWHNSRDCIVKVLAVHSEDEFKFSHKNVWKQLQNHSIYFEWTEHAEVMEQQEVRETLGNLNEKFSARKFVAFKS